jgi:hypothetical protein
MCSELILQASKCVRILISDVFFQNNSKGINDVDLKERCSDVANSLFLCLSSKVKRQFV